MEKFSRPALIARFGRFGARRLATSSRFSDRRARLPAGHVQSGTELISETLQIRGQIFTQAVQVLGGRIAHAKINRPRQRAGVECIALGGRVQVRRRQSDQIRPALSRRERGYVVRAAKERVADGIAQG